jgi:hypothetical protein
VPHTAQIHEVSIACNGRRSLVAVLLFRRSWTQAVCSFVFHCHRQPLCDHRTENEACCVWKNAAVKKPSVRWLPFKTKLSIAAVATARARMPLAFRLLLADTIYCMNHILDNKSLTFTTETQL